MQEKITVMGVRFDNIRITDTVDFVIDSLEENKKGYICTPNPEMLLEAKNNNLFRNVLNKSLLNIPDGIGVLWAATNIANKNSKIKALLTLPLIIINPKRFKYVLKQRVTGIDLMLAICKKCAQTGHSIFLLGAKEGVAKTAALKLNKKYPKLKIKGTFAGSPKEKDKENIIKIINNHEPDILFVAYGAPNQEFWITNNLKSLRTVKIAIGIGGALDFISQKKQRAPKWMQKTGTEWLFRLIQEPSRIRRIINATIKFPCEIIKKL